MKTLTIHFLTHTCIPYGTYFRCHNLAVALVSSGQKVTIFTVDPNIKKAKEEIRDGVRYSLIPYSRFNCLKRCAIDYPKCDIAHLFQPLLSPALAWRWTMRSKAEKMFYDWDDLWMGESINPQAPLRGIFKYLTVGQIESAFPKAADGVTAISHFLSDLAYQRKARKVTLLYNGVWDYPLIEKKLARKKLNLHEDAIYIGFMGNHYGLLDWCFKVLEKNLEISPRLRFALCGDHDVAYLEQLPLAVQQRLDFLGYIPSSLTREFSAALDIGLLPLSDIAHHNSRLPYKLTEYLAAGTPVLCSDIGECSIIAKDFPSIIRAGKTCDDFVESSSRAISLAMSDALPEVNQAKLKSIFSWDLISHQLLDSYHESLGY